MLEVFTVGGGEYLVNVFNAVAAWSGGGGYRSMLQVVMVMGLTYSLFVVAFSLDWRAWFNWFAQATLIYMLLIVPTVSVKITDRIDPGLPAATVSNVPLGLGMLASLTSQLGDWMTTTAETVFVMPNALNLTSNGMVYGARLLDKAQSFQITDAEFRANLDEHIKQCVFYDVLLGFKSLDTLTRSSDLWSAIGPGSPARSQKWLPDEGSGAAAATVLPCAEAYGRLSAQWQAEFEDDLLPFAKQAYPKLADSVAVTKLRADLPAVAGRMHGTAPADAFAYLRQVSMIDAFRAARESFSDASWDAYASQRADAQAKNTYTSIAQQAMTWVPLLWIVLTAVFYAMFPVIFPLFLLPRTDLATLKGYATGFFYLAAWGPLYVVLHMFVMSRAADAMSAVAPGGPTLLVSDGIQAVNNDVATVAGFLMMSVPFLAAGMARGAMAIAGQATSMLAPAQSAAEAAANERTTGNYAYGNLSYANTTANTVQANKWDQTSTLSSGFASETFRHAGGTSASFTADGSVIYNAAGGMSVLPFRPTVTRAQTAEMREAASESYQEAQQLRNSAQEAWAAGDRLNHAVSSGTRSSAGTQSSSGVESGSSTAEYDRRGRSKTESSGQSRDITQSVSGSESARDQYTSRETTSLSASAGIGSRGGRTGTSPIGGSGLGANIGYGRDASDGISWEAGTTSTQSDSSSDSRSSSFQDQHSNGRDVQVSDGSYSRSGHHSQVERFAADTRTAEEYYDHSRRLSREAAETEERARRLEQAASFAETQSFSLNEDLSQYLASRYIEKQNGDLWELNLPDLYRTDLDRDQRASRDYAVRQILEDFIRGPRDSVVDRLDKPDGLDLVPPSSFGLADLKAGQTRPSRLSPPEVAPSEDQGRREEIKEGRRALDDVAAARQVLREQAAVGASALSTRQHRASSNGWFKDRE